MAIPQSFQCGPDVCGNQKRAQTLPWQAGITGGCELLSVGAGNGAGVPEVWRALFTAKPSFQAPPAPSPTYS